jgi:4-amino-4-deoxy-L-arabinose transferase-like glycosyltransferase
MSRVTDHFSRTLRLRISYDGTRTPAKTALFLVVCVAWLLPGLVGHDPWKTDEAIAFGVVNEMLRSGDWLVPALAGETYLEHAPLFFWVAAAFAKALGGWFAPHDAARLASGVFMGITMASVSVAAIALYGERAGRISVLLFIGCLGILIRAHEMSTDLAGLAGLSLALAGIALAAKSPLSGGAIAGLGIGVAFLGDGFFPATIALLVALLMPLTGKSWRTLDCTRALGVALAVAAPFLLAWPIALALKAPGVWSDWAGIALATRWSGGGTSGTLADTFYFARILPWYAWPALPLAAWTVWHSRRTLARRTELHLPLVATAVFFIALSAVAEAREVNAMPLLLPLVLLGAADLDTLPRGAASALDWFGVTTFALFALLIWIGFVAVMTGSPPAAAAWVAREIPGYEYRFRFLPFALAALLTCIWVVIVARSLRTTRRAVVNWAAGTTMVWMLAMTLGLPLIDQARSYRGMAVQLKEQIGTSRCTIGVGVGDAQRALFDYFMQTQFWRPGHVGARYCDTLLAQGSGGRMPAVDEVEWTEAWRGARPGDQNEVFVLYRRAR